MVRSIRPDLKRATPDKPLMVIKHHLYTNFTMYGMEEPTWINVAREPVSRFVSSYYFRRYGFNRHSGARNKKVLDGQWSVDMVSGTAAHVYAFLTVFGCGLFRSKLNEILKITTLENEQLRNGGKLERPRFGLHVSQTEI